MWSYPELPSSCFWRPRTRKRQTGVWLTSKKEKSGWRWKACRLCGRSDRTENDFFKGLFLPSDSWTLSKVPTRFANRKEPLRSLQKEKRDEATPLDLLCLSQRNQRCKQNQWTRWGGAVELRTSAETKQMMTNKWNAVNGHGGGGWEVVSLMSRCWWWWGRRGSTTGQVLLTFQGF